MLDTATLRQIIKEIYNLDDDCIKAITTNWFFFNSTTYKIRSI